MVLSWAGFFDRSRTSTYVDIWIQDLKDFARQSSLDVVYSETGRDSGRG